MLTFVGNWWVPAGPWFKPDCDRGPRLRDIAHALRSCVELGTLLAARRSRTVSYLRY